MKVLRISDTLSLPAESVTQTFAILAKRGVGKTHTAVVLVEEMIAASLPVVVIDPIGVWYGLRSSADGAKAGLPVIILGGEHGNLPLEESSGSVVADFVIETRQALVLDLALFSKSGARRFMVDFAERLYRGKATQKEPLHVVLDEADSFVPQRTEHGAERLVGAINDLVRRGRARGLGVTLISQRPALINKDVLTQIEVLIALRMTGPQDRDALQRWIEHNADDTQAKLVLSSLAELPIGTAWVWSPGWLQKPVVKVAIRQRHTFDSSATPQIGATKIEPRALAPVDLEALKGRMAATIEKAKADDPRELKRRIAELEKQVKVSAASASERACVVCHKSAPAGSGAWACHTDLDTTPVHCGPCFQKYQAQKPPVPAVSTEVLHGLVDELCDRAAALVASAQTIRMSCERVAARKRVETRSDARVDAGPRPPVDLFHPPAMPERAKASPGAGVSSSRSWATIGRCGRALLHVLAQRDPRATSRAQLAILSGYSSTSSSFSNALGALRSGGLARGAGDANYITEEGRATAGDVEPLPSGPELVRYWQSKLGKCEATLLGILVDAHPKDVSRDSLAHASGYSATSSSFSNALGRLRTLELVNGFRASDAMMGDS